MTDPFANDPFQDDEPMAPEGLWDEAVTDNSDNKEKIIVNASEHPKVVVTEKASGDFDAPWLVFHAQSVAEAKQLVQEADAEELVRFVAIGARRFQEAWRDSQQSSGGGQQRRQQSSGRRPGKPAGASKPPNGEEAPECRHGAMKYVAGTKNKGGELIEWKAWMCPEPKDSRDKCKPQWIND